MENSNCESLVQRAHRLLAERLQEGDTVVDATIGNGHDTLFLARQVGSEGKVYGFDIQGPALEATSARLRAAGFAARVRLLLAGHEKMGEYLPEEERGRIQAVLFNLGYLPAGHKEIITGPGTTLAALANAAEWLAPAGVISVIAYTGHPGGREETEQVKRWAAGLPAPWGVKTEVPPSRGGNAPEWILIERDKDTDPSVGAVL